jgi:FkbM family methyltransferase
VAKKNPTKNKPYWRILLRLIRKRWWRKSYSQHGEDIVLLTIFNGVSKGFYVDVGSFHPRQYSNTRALFENGWHGINIDISKRKLKLFDFDRPNDQNIFCAASDKPAELKAYIFENGSALDTTDKKTADIWSEQFNMPYEEVSVPSRPLTDILEQCNAPRVDYLNIDVEGAETAVLKGLDFSKYAPQCISIEIHQGIEEAKNSAPYQLLHEQGYELRAWLPPTFFFIKPD